VISSYAGTYGLYKFIAGNPKPVKAKIVKEQPAPAANAVSAGGFQGPTEKNMDQWFKNEQNIKDWEKWVQTPGNLEKWEKSLK
jgi:hypothetical protein